VIYGHQDLLEIGAVYSPALDRYSASEQMALRESEHFYQNHQEYVFVTPIYGLDRVIGRVYLTYSKGDLHANVRKGFLITLAVSLGALAIGLLLSFAYFRHISRPMDVLLAGVESLDGDRSDVRIHMDTRNEFAILADAFNAMSERIDDARRTYAARERMRREFELAREIQHSLLPDALASPRGYEIDHYYQAAHEVGGDYVDVVPLDDDRMAIAMGDVSGKGIQGLVVMAMVKTLFQQLAPRCEDTRAIICDLNAALYGNIKANMFVTFVSAIFDARTGVMTISNAGHNPVLVYRKNSGTVDQIRMGGPPLGAFGAMHFNELIEMQEVELKPGDAALIYTDGINESRNPHGQLYTIPRVAEVLRGYAADGARAIVNGIIGETTEFRQGVPQNDDVTLLVVKAPADVPAPEFETSEAER
jgi:sigma-B regulation protein RsbU (phosphoserine phosphatase)